jgi:hypothetical protein
VRLVMKKLKTGKVLIALDCLLCIFARTRCVEWGL